MTRNEVLYKVIEIVNEHKSDKAPNVTENTRLTNDLGMDSLDIAEAGVHIETKLAVRFDNEDYDNIKFKNMSVNDLVNCVCKKLNIPVNNTEKKSNLKLNVLYPIIACLLFAGCDLIENKKNVVVVPGKNKIVVKDVKDGQERIFFTNKSDNRFQYLNVGDTINVCKRTGYDNYNYYKVLNDDNNAASVDKRDLHIAQEKFKFDSIKNKMLMDNNAQNKR